jgi:hypothetical protein
MVKKLPEQMFLDLSAALTGFTVEELQGTGMAAAYYNELTAIVDSAICSRLWDVWHKVDAASHANQDRLERGIRRKIYDSTEFGPLARNIIGMWYLGNWSQLPAAWHSEFGAKAPDTDHVISALAYQAGLVWTVMGTHPQAAKQPGYGSWAQPPTVLVAPAQRRSGRE